MSEKTEKPQAPSFLNWVTQQAERDDVVGIYSRAVVDDFQKGNRFKLADTAISIAQDWDLGCFLHYSRAHGLPTGTGQLLQLGNIMAMLEYNIGLISDTIPHPPFNDDQTDALRLRIAELTDQIPPIIQELELDYRLGE